MNIFFVIFASYILASIPFGYLITKFFLKKDVRTIGSGNIGATNVLRSGSKKLAIFTLILDFGKSFLALFLCSLFAENENYIYVALLFTVIGHIFPIWLKFKGGKGIAAFVGSHIFILGFYSIFLILFWILIGFIFRISSLAGLSMVLLAFIISLFSGNYIWMLFEFITVCLIFYAHRENISRLLKKEETKVKF